MGITRHQSAAQGERFKKKHCTFSPAPLRLSQRQRKPVAALTAELKQQRCSWSSFVQFPLQVSCSCFGSNYSRCSLLGSKEVFFWLGFLYADQGQGRQLFLSVEVKRVLSFEFDNKSKLFLEKRYQQGSLGSVLF